MTPIEAREASHGPPNPNEENDFSPEKLAQIADDIIEIARGSLQHEPNSTTTVPRGNKIVYEITDFESKRRKSLRIRKFTISGTSRSLKSSIFARVNKDSDGKPVWGKVVFGNSINGRLERYTNTESAVDYATRYVAALGAFAVDPVALV